MEKFIILNLNIFVLCCIVYNANCLSILPRCEILYPIKNNKISPTYALDETENQCYLFKSRAHLELENCKRRNAQRSTLEEVCKKDCCKCLPKEPLCPAIYDPICAEYKHKPTEYGNLCIYTGAVCRATGYNANPSNGPFYIDSQMCPQKSDKV